MRQGARVGYTCGMGRVELDGILPAVRLVLLTAFGFSVQGSGIGRIFRVKEYQVSLTGVRGCKRRGFRSTRPGTRRPPLFALSHTLTHTLTQERWLTAAERRGNTFSLESLEGL